MTGQDAVTVAESFNERLGITGVVLTKMDGDARGGAALSIRSVTGAPVKFVGMGEKLSEMEVFHPDRIAGRILGMGDVLTLVEKAQSAINAEEAEELALKMKKASFDLEDFRTQMRRIKKLGSLDSILKMIPGMTYAAHTAPGPHTRCVFDLTDAQGRERRLFFDDVRAFGLLLAGTPQTMQQWSFWRELGPEPLELTDAAFSARLDSKNSAIKAVLLDQKVIAGVGNIYADESLFAAGIDPRRKACSLSAAQRSRLLRCLKDVLELSISQCGSSIRDYRDANGNVGAFQNSFAVYGRNGQACKACGRALEKIKVAGRATVYCPHCQK